MWSDDGETVAVGGPRLRALLAMLLLNVGQTVSVRRLVEGLYGPQAPSGAAHSLQSQVSRLRRRLGAVGETKDLLEFGPAGYRLLVDPDDVDVHRFERLAGEGRHVLATGDHDGAARLLGEALGLWRGPALADVIDAPFAGEQAARLEELRVAVLEDLVEARLAHGEHRDLAAELPEIVVAHPLRERLRGQLMRALYGSGRKAEALQVFEDARRTMAEELGVDPSPELGDVHLAVLRAGPSPAEAGGGVPAQFTSFVGRDGDLERVRALLGERRLVTLTGPGGVGKTRLAVEAAGRERDEVRFVDLAPLTDGAAAPQVLINALGLREAGLVPALSGPLDPVERLIAGLADRRVLLVLDNCEHVVAEIAVLARRLLAACRDLRILVTSRERLGVTGETLHPVPPLPLDGGPEAPGHPAVRLFADRAAAVRPGFLIDEANADAVLRVCRALDGLPLAIELAAARMRSLTLQEIEARLDDRFRLLSRGDRSAAPRHRTLRSVVEWSWDLLSHPEQALAARLTVFSGGASLHAAARVCGPSEGEVVELLADLVDKSLVEAGGGRYRMLETVHEFCAERLAGDGGRERVRAAHAAYFLELARTAEPHLRGPDQLEWLARLDAERGNLHAALHWAAGADPTLGLRLLAALSWQGQVRGLPGERAAVAAGLLMTVGDEPPAGLEEEYALCLAHAAAADNAHDRRLRDQLERLADRRLRHPFLRVLRLMVNGPRHADGEISADPWSQAFTRLESGAKSLFDGERDAAERAFRAALEGFRGTGDRWGVLAALEQMAGLADETEFAALMAEAIDLAGRLGAVEDLTRLLVGKADGLADAGRLLAARAEYERAIEFARRAGTPETRADARRGLADVARLRGDLPAARELYDRALRGCDRASMGAARTRWRILTGLGRVAEAEQDTGQARLRYRQALAAARAYGDRTAVAASAEALAAMDVFDADGR
ncbi:BTAD domain-containing putative transcriptional regulator [Streptosporangium sp. 'caverna']|uniref:BTAD domain-containing putative transcriptional regulator n=1 Tax=Streptosporangium sp. 'caverna' TaxID=2202249 RepID=UPI001955125E|nr:BTAD domain-containing putative transcriptional regulator [Streptosporangium sp. 'caverna']